MNFGLLSTYGIKGEKMKRAFVLFDLYSEDGIEQLKEYGIKVYRVIAIEHQGEGMIHDYDYFALIGANDEKGLKYLLGRIKKGLKLKDLRMLIIF
jgi:hypothetical protein